MERDAEGGRTGPPETLTILKQYPGIKKGKVEELIRKFPNASSKAIGEMAYKQNPLLFKNSEQARSEVRRLRGRQGNRNRRWAKMAPSPFTTKPILDDDFPEGKEQSPGWGPVQFNGPLNALILSDIHIPYHYNPAVTAAIEYGRKHQADFILLNGDIIDFYAASRWQTDPKQRDLKGELETTRAFLKLLRKKFPKAKIVFKEGNHEERWSRWLIDKAEIAYGVPDFELVQLLRLNDLDIQHVKDKRPIRLGDLNVIHGHEYRFNISNPVNPARGVFLKCRAPVLGGHMHQKSEHSGGTVDGRIIAAWSTGCMSDLQDRKSVV